MVSASFSTHTNPPAPKVSNALVSVPPFSRYCPRIYPHTHYLMLLTHPLPQMSAFNKPPDETEKTAAAPSPVKQCKNPECNNPLSHNNKTGICMKCIEKANEAKRQYCKTPECNNPLDYRNNTGICKDCIEKAKPETQYCETPECNNPLYNHNKTGICMKCIEKANKGKKQYCENPECNNPLSHRNKIGICKECIEKAKPEKQYCENPECNNPLHSLSYKDICKECIEKANEAKKQYCKDCKINLLDYKNKTGICKECIDKAKPEKHNCGFPLCPIQINIVNTYCSRHKDYMSRNRLTTGKICLGFPGHECDVHMKTRSYVCIYCFDTYYRCIEPDLTREEFNDRIESINLSEAISDFDNMNVKNDEEEEDKKPAAKEEEEEEDIKKPAAEEEE